MTSTPHTILLFLSCLCSLTVGGGHTPPPTRQAVQQPAVSHAQSACNQRSAPVVIDGVTASDRARIEVTFQHDATDATIRLWGAEGLLLDVAPVQGSFAAGQTVTFTPRLSPGGGRIVVAVTATFDGRRDHALSGFAVPGGGAGAATAELDASGNRVRVHTARMGS